MPPWFLSVWVEDWNVHHVPCVFGGRVGFGPLRKWVTRRAASQTTKPEWVNLKQRLSVRVTSVQHIHCGRRETNKNNTKCCKALWTVGDGTAPPTLMLDYIHLPTQRNSYHHHYYHHRAPSRSFLFSLAERSHIENNWDTIVIYVYLGRE